MVIDKLTNGNLYKALGKNIAAAINFLQTTDLVALENGKYELDGTNLFAIVSEYETKLAENEQMEAHKKYIDVQYVVSGAECFGHAFYTNQTASKEYDETKDFWLTADAPQFFSLATAGTFTIFFPNDLHMPGIAIENTPAMVKKVVLKVLIEA